jgi:predicted phage-related endonuclease
MSRFLISEHEQGSDGWRADRAGRATASKANCIDAKGRDGKESTTRRDYIVQLVTERLTGAPADDVFVNKEMAWGTEQEPYARMAYEAATGEEVRQVGFCYLPDIAAGGSPDSLIGDEGLLEIKCPKTATHIAYLQENRLPPAYVAQVTHNLWVTGYAWADFVSFDPRLPEYLQLFRVRVLRAELNIAAHEAAVLRFLSEVDALEKTLRARAPVALAA